MFNKSIEIAEKLGQLREASIHKDVRLRKASRVKTIYASCAIENNTMTLDEVTAILNGKVVLGPLDDILEIQNAACAYDDFEAYHPYCIDDLLKAHAHMTHHAITESGQFRTKGVGVIKGNKIVHQGAQSYLVPQLIEDLFIWCKTEGIHPLIQSCVVHYEIENIHPFADGNGRMGRLWQSVILASWHDTFRWIPVESLIYAHQQTYYDVLQQCHEMGQCNAFIEFMLDIILQTLDEMLTEWNQAGRPLRPQGGLENSKSGLENSKSGLENSKSGLESPKTIDEILRLMSETPGITLEQIATKLGRCRSAIAKHIKTLKTLGYIKREGSTKKGTWRVLKK